MYKDYSLSDVFSTLYTPFVSDRFFENIVVASSANIPCILIVISIVNAITCHDLPTALLMKHAILIVIRHSMRTDKIKKNSHEHTRNEKGKVWFKNRPKIRVQQTYPIILSGMRSGHMHMRIYMSFPGNKYGTAVFGIPNLTFSNAAILFVVRSTISPRMHRI